MTRTSRPALLLLFFATVLLCADRAGAQSASRDPSVGYLYPAGGQQGTTVHLVAGGQNLRNVSDVSVSGDGAQARIVRYMGRFRRLNGQERRELQRRLDELRNPRARTETVEKVEKTETETVKLPNHPLLNELENLSAWELEFVENNLLRTNRKEQPNAQIAESILIEVEIEPGSTPGDRELRLSTSSGMTNPLCFQIGQIPESCEAEPYNPSAPPTDPLYVPLVMNGQIKPGDIDRFRFRAGEGQQLVIAVSARQLIPFLADAVPGWFQATIALFDEAGREVGFTDDFRFSPDPVLFFSVPATGIYEIEIRDSIYRGRDDFVYRVAIDEQPFITSVFPLGGREGEKTVAEISGWNLRRKNLRLDTRPGSGSIRHVTLHQDDHLSNMVAYAVDDLPECTESEPNSSREKSERIDLPTIVNGRIGEPGDVDYFRFRGGAGNELVAEVTARRLYSPVDSVVKIYDASGKVVDWNDDLTDRQGWLHRDMGTLTHHADSYLRARLPRNGTYYVAISDSRNHGGNAYAYRLRLSRPRPDFELHVTPSSVALPTGRATPVCVHALRRDGFDGPIEVRLKDPPPGFGLQGGLIQKGCDRIRATLSAPSRPNAEPVTIELEGMAKIGGETVRRRVVPADDKMQAFLYRHLVPSQELLATVIGPRVRFPVPPLTVDDPVRIRSGGTGRLRIDLPKRAKLENVDLDLSEPPEGLGLEDWSLQRGSLDLVFSADAETAPPGRTGNLIVEVFVLRQGRQRPGDKKPPMQRIPVGVLPAIPYQIVSR